MHHCYRRNRLLNFCLSDSWMVYGILIRKIQIKCIWCKHWIEVTQNFSNGVPNIWAPGLFSYYSLVLTDYVRVSIWKRPLPVHNDYLSHSASCSLNNQVLSQGWKRPNMYLISSLDSPLSYFHYPSTSSWCDLCPGKQHFYVCKIRGSRDFGY
jgi:hypothetical protein